MFVLTETAKAVQNSDSEVLGIILGIGLLVCVVMFVYGIVYTRRK